MHTTINSQVSKRKAPTVLSLLSDIGTPVSIFHKLSAQEDTAFLFESTEGDSRLARYSFIGVDPVKTISFRAGIASVLTTATQQLETTQIDNPLLFLKELLETEGYCAPEGEPEFPFAGGLVGYLGYGATSYFEGIVRQENDPFSVPDGYYGLYDSVIAFDHQYRKLKIISHRGPEHAAELLYRLTTGGCTLTPLTDRTGASCAQEIFAGVSGPFTRDSFISLVEQSKQYIYEGQVFQIVVSQRFSQPVTASELDIYRHLQALNPSPYGYLLKFPDFTYIGSSPETFVKCHNRQVTLRALAGTRPRGQTEEEDKKLTVELRADEKELAEHRMLVDLGRNDLGRICQPGSISVGEIATVTKYTHVMHLATEITGKLRDDKSAFEAFQSCFPRGTVSGAPKIRAMQLLSQLEPEQRGIYSGVVGYFDFNGNADGAIAIRSALIKDGFAHVNAGAGIVFDSKPESEYEETRNKAMSVIKAIKLAEVK
jgi:anthranilate synthase component 1